MSVSAYLLDPATKHAAVAARVRRAWRRAQSAEFVLAVGLRRLFRDLVHRGEGFSRFPDYAEFRFGIPGKLASLLSFIGKHLERLPRVRAALERGDLTYTKAREFVRLATPEDEADWIAFARSATNRQLERRVARARRVTGEDTRRVVSRLTAREVQAVRMAREMFLRRLDEPVREEKLLPVLAETVLAGGLVAERRPAPPGPYLAIHLCPRCLRTWVPVPGEDLVVPIERWVGALKAGARVEDFTSKLLCDCEGVRHRRDLCPRFRPTEGPPPESRHVPAAVRRRVEARDGFRCRTPGCANPVPLEAGHLRPFREGAPMLEEFLCQQCATCNDLIESGRLRVEGEAPYDRYYLADGSFLGFGFDPDPHVGTSGEGKEGEARGVSGPGCPDPAPRRSRRPARPAARS